LPNLHNFDANDRDEKNFLTWLGISKDAIKKIYQEEIKALMPTANPPEGTGKAGGKKPAGKNSAKAKAKK
jgi:hypothetical protein